MLPFLLTKKMLTVTDEAINALRAHCWAYQIEVPIIRITLLHGCCKGESLRFTLCKLQHNDLIFDFGSIIFVIDRKLSAKCGAINVDFQEEYEQCLCSGRNGGFNVTSERFSQRCGWAGCWETCDGSCCQERKVFSQRHVESAAFC